MQIEILTLAICNFFILMALQLIIRKIIECNEDKMLLFVWLVLPLPIILVERYLALGDVSAIMLLTYLLAGAWIVSFPAIYAASPTLVILLLIDRGINDKETLIKKSHTGGNSKERIDDALKFGFIRLKDGKVSLTVLGNSFYRLMHLLKLIHGINKVEAL